MHSNTNLNKITEITDTNTNTSYDNLRVIDTFIDAFASSIEFYSRLYSAFIDALSVPFSDARKQIKDIRKEIMPDKDLLLLLFNYDKQQEFYNKTEKVILSSIRDKFDKNLEKTFVLSLSEFIDSYCKLARITGAGILYQHMSNASAFWNNMYIEPIRDMMYRTPSHKIHSENKYSLFHYYPSHENDDNNNRLMVEQENEKIIDNKIADTGFSAYQYSSLDSTLSSSSSSSSSSMPRPPPLLRNLLNLLLICFNG
ncbi:MAG TPA: hypothetical protein VLE21_02550 [Candidatus Nitrosocosmicus sp.]|nr:hypothetical protein [Candidatus Nitrosocosmicus sp.]